MTLTYVAYSSFDLDSANSVQTFLTCRELARLDPRLRTILPKSPRRQGDDRGLAVTFVDKLPLRWLLGETGERVERQLFARRAARLARDFGAPVYTRDLVVAEHCAAAGLAVVLEIHDHDDAAEPVLEQVGCVVVLNETLADQLRRAHAIRRVEVIPDAYDSSVFRPLPRQAARDRLGIAAEAFVVGYAGLTFDGRGVDRLLAAFDLLTAPADRRLLLLGGRREELDRLHVAGRSDVHAPGRSSQEDVAQSLAAADVVVIPGAVGGAAASPLKMFEYAALEIPIVAPDRAEIRGVLGGDACYFADGDTDALAAALREVAAQPESWRSRARALRAALGGFDYAERARRILRVTGQESK